MSVIYARPLPEAISNPSGSIGAVPWVLNLSRLRYGCQRCTLAVAQHCPSPIKNLNFEACVQIQNVRVPMYIFVSVRSI